MKRSRNELLAPVSEVKRERPSVEEEETYVVPDVDHNPSPVQRSSFQLVNVDVTPGTPVDRTKLKNVGSFVIGQTLGSSPVSSIVQCLARIPNDPSDRFYVIKILTLPDDPSKETRDETQGKMLIHTEYSLLSMLENQEGVIQCHGLYKDVALEEIEVEDELGNPKLVYSGKTKQRISLVLDCLYPHEYSPESKQFVNLQKYVIQEKQLSEKTSMKIFYHIVNIVNDLHSRNIVHRDLKLGNMILNRNTKKVTLVNFCLGKHLLNDLDLLKDQRGSPAYISPDVLSGNPYQGKPSDIWSLGVVLYTMIYGQFPFYDPDPRSLLTKIKNGSFSLPKDVKVSEATQDLISKMLHQNPKLRLTSSQVLDSVKRIIGLRTRSALFQGLQVVPDLESEMKSRSCFNSVVSRLEALKQLTRRPANSNPNVFVTSISTNSSPVAVTHPPTIRQTTSRLRETLMGPPRAPSRINIVQVESDPRVLSNHEVTQLRRRVAAQSIDQTQSVDDQPSATVDDPRLTNPSRLNRRGSL